MATSFPRERQSKTLTCTPSCRPIKDQLLMSMRSSTYPVAKDCDLIRQFIQLETDKYTMIRLSEILSRNERSGGRQFVVVALAQLAKIGLELLKVEKDRRPGWRHVDFGGRVNDIVYHPIGQMDGGLAILQSMGFTEMKDSSIAYPETSKPDDFPDHVGAWAVELVLAAAEVFSSLVGLDHLNVEALKLLLNVNDAFGPRHEGSQT